MKSNEFDDLPEDQKIVMSKAMLGHGLDRVSKKIDGFTSAKLKRVLKTVSMVFLAEKSLDENARMNLKEDEQKLIDDIFALQETVFGHQTLLKELSEQNNNETDNTVSIETSLEKSNE